MQFYEPRRTQVSYWLRRSIYLNTVQSTDIPSMARRVARDLHVFAFDQEMILNKKRFYNWLLDNDFGAN